MNVAEPARPHPVPQNRYNIKKGGPLSLHDTVLHNLHLQVLVMIESSVRIRAVPCNSTRCLCIQKHEFRLGQLDQSGAELSCEMAPRCKLDRRFVMQCNAMVGRWLASAFTSLASQYRWKVHPQTASQDPSGQSSLGLSRPRNVDESVRCISVPCGMVCTTSSHSSIMFAGSRSLRTVRKVASRASKQGTRHLETTNGVPYRNDEQIGSLFLTEYRRRRKQPIFER